MTARLQYTILSALKWKANMNIDSMHICKLMIRIMGPKKVKSTLTKYTNTVMPITIAAVEKAAAITASVSETAAQEATRYDSQRVKSPNMM